MYPRLKYYSTVYHAYLNLTIIRNLAKKSLVTICMLRSKRSNLFIICSLENEKCSKKYQTFDDISSIFQCIVFFHIPSSISTLDNLCSILENFASIVDSMFNTCALIKLR
ncbi:hypothetical protein BLOT_014374 [Blomia tropicalis]|nr:hypothetical protein BLOT_014374 [Blomia tropicalis]